MKTRYFALEDSPPTERGIWGLIRQNGHKVERWLPKQGWFESPRDWRHLTDSSNASREITPELAEAIQSDGNVVQLTDEQLASLR